MNTMIKIVPEASPNADGEWIIAPVEMPKTTRWRTAERALAPHIPAGYVMVAYRATSQTVTSEGRPYLRITRD